MKSKLLERGSALVGLLVISLAPTACSVEGGSGAALDDDGGTAEGEDGPEEFEPVPARGISIDEIEINQGTRIPVGFGGEWVDGPDRNGFLIASRDSLLRIHYTVDEGWVPREIEARVTLDFPDGESVTLTKTKMIEESSQPYSLDGGFWFGLIADQGQTVTGTTYSVELWEVAQSAGLELDEGVWANPADGPKLIGFEAVPMQIKTILVPIEYNGTLPDLSDETIETVVNNLYEQNPTTEILHSVHSPVAYEQNLTNLGQLLPFMQGLRANENADPNVYYHALVNVGSQSLNSVLGISLLATDQKADASSRVSATVIWTPDPSIGADTFTHETGHAQGLNHVECPNAESAGPDPSYPHENGRIGNWGFGIRRFLMYDPDDAFDYMSYCSPSWVSDWTWNKTYKRIKTLTSWDFGGAPASAAPEAQGQLIYGALYPDGTTEYWTVPGTVAPERISGPDRFEFEVDGEVVEAWGEIQVLSDDETVFVRAQMPVGLDELDRVDAITHVRADRRTPVNPEALVIDISAATDWAGR